MNNNTDQDPIGYNIKKASEKELYKLFNSIDDDIPTAEAQVRFRKVIEETIGENTVLGQDIMLRGSMGDLDHYLYRMCMFRDTLEKLREIKEPLLNVHGGRRRQTRRAAKHRR